MRLFVGVRICFLPGNTSAPCKAELVLPAFFIPTRGRFILAHESREEKRIPADRQNYFTSPGNAKGRAAAYSGTPVGNAPIFHTEKCRHFTLFASCGMGAEIPQPGVPMGSLPLPTLQQSPAALIECVDMLTTFQSFFRLGRICLCRCFANYPAKAPSPVKSRTPPGDVRGGTR